MRYLAASLLLLLPLAAAAQSYLPRYDSAYEAQVNCPYDRVDLINTQKAIHQYRGQPPAPHKDAYVCEQQAIVAGYGGLLVHLKPMAKAPTSR